MPNATRTRTKSPRPLSSWSSPCATPSKGTQFGGLRPFGVSFLFAGWDKNYGFQLYMSDPSGNYGGWKAAAVGANNRAAQSILKQDYKDDMGREEAVQLAVKVLSKTMDSTHSRSSARPWIARTQAGGDFLDPLRGHEVPSVLP
ncbi:hypothetical protein MLD38_028625 [Melastoma candidum]|uniref:Uncharacterized protein n=1 Tax=Melastoma candidum TaxID=119954 RepID=A0ACB9N1A5_9MYRT|nr:hypothetical protein MLD38_028625 [Melastoma candidum]